MKFLYAASLALTLISCSGDDPSSTIDSGIMPDAVTPDAEVTRPGLALAVPCAELAGDVYSALAESSDELGAIVACAEVDSATASEVTTRLSGVPGVTVRSGFRRYLIAYRTERETGNLGTGTAVLLVPDTPSESSRPIVVATHGTAGLADKCAPSALADSEGQDALLLPWLAAGYTVIAPDYAGLGNPGVQGYAHAPDTSHSVLDAGRAAIAALASGSVDHDIIIAGHSQGGSAAMGAQALGQPYGGADINVAAVVSYAGNVSENKFLRAWRFPGLFPIGGGAGVTRAVVALSLYSEFSNLLGEERAGEAFHPSIRAHVVDTIENKCIFGIATALALPSASYVVPRNLADLANPTVQQEISDCVETSTCTPFAEEYVARTQASEILPDSQGAPILMINGSDDVQSTVGRQACTRDFLVANGITPSLCVLSKRTHFDIVPNAASFAIEWAQATLSGTTLPECPEVTNLPDCP